MLLTNDSTHSLFTRVANRVGCGKLSPQAELTCMQWVPAKKLENAVVQTLSFFIPYVDDQTAFSDLQERAARGQLADYVRTLS